MAVKSMQEHGASFSLGAFFSLSAGVCWGAMAVAAQVLLTNDSGITSMGMVTVRLLVAGLFLVLLSARKALVPLQTLRDAIDVLIAGALVFGGQFCFMQAIVYTSAGVAAILLTTVPFWAAFWQACVEKTLPSRRELLCFLLAVSGVALIVTHGDITSLSFDLRGVAWGMGSAILSAGYSIQPRRILRRAPVIAVMGWAMLFGGVLASCCVPPWRIDFDPSGHNWLLLLVVVGIGTVCSFYCYLRAISLISPVIVGLIGTSEPLSAYVFSVIFLGVVVSGAELVGAALVLSAVVTVSLAGGRIRWRAQLRKAKTRLKSKSLSRVK